MNIAEQAFRELFHEKNINDYEFKIKYSGKFKGYNANVRYKLNSYTFNLSKKWKSISKEIKIGLIQNLLLRIFKTKKTTTNIDLYNLFMKNVHISVPKTITNPILEKSFDRINEKYFYGLIEKPNLKFANSTSKLGSYDYGTDTITISRTLEDQELMDYVMYHEILHKKHKFKEKKGRNYHHTKPFKTEEKKFENSKEIEEKLKRLTNKRKNLFSLFKSQIKLF